jgi:hypothetical protein
MDEPRDDLLADSRFSSDQNFCIGACGAFEVGLERADRVTATD